MDPYDQLKNRRVNDLVLNSSYQSYASNHVQKQLQNLDHFNRRSQSRTGGIFGSDDHINFDQSTMLVVALSTIVMLARKETVAERNYLYTKILLESILDENGLQLSNVPQLLAHMKYVYIQKKIIADDGTNEGDEITIIKPNEELVDPKELDISLRATSVEFIAHTPMLASTPKRNRLRTNLVPKLTDITEIENSNEALPEEDANVEDVNDEQNITPANNNE